MKISSIFVAFLENMNFNNSMVSEKESFKKYEKKRNWILLHKWVQQNIVLYTNVTHFSRSIGTFGIAICHP